VSLAASSNTFFERRNESRKNYYHDASPANPEIFLCWLRCFFSKDRVIPLSEDTPVQKISRALHEPDGMADLALVIVWLAASILVIYLPIINESVLRYVLTIPFVLFIPGYCLIAALFPREGDLSLLERIALSFGLSIAIVPFIGLGLNFTPWGIRLDPILIFLTIFTMVMVLIAFFRRAFFPSEERFRIPFSAISGIIREGIFPSEGSKIDRLLSIILVLVIIVALVTTIYVIVSPKEGEHFSEFYILGENRTAADYPDQIIAGIPSPMFIGVGNHEYQNVTYTIETWATQTEFDTTTNTSTILSMDPLARTSLVLSHNETVVIPYNLSINKAGYNRVEFLLFNETVPGMDVTGSDRINESFHSLNLWIAVG
jgi:uncharacterized membrane protein